MKKMHRGLHIPARRKQVGVREKMPCICLGKCQSGTDLFLFFVSFFPFFPDKGTVRSKEIVVSVHCGASQRSKGFEGRKFDIRKLKSFALLCRKDIAKSCFYSTINIKRPRTQGFDNMHQYWIQKMKKEDIVREIREIGQKADSSSAHAGTRVLPITDASIVEQCSNKTDKKVMPNGESKNKAKSRMKELLRWAMASKSEKGGRFITGKVMFLTSLTTCPCWMPEISLYKKFN